MSGNQEATKSEEEKKAEEAEIDTEEKADDPTENKGEENASRKEERATEQEPEITAGDEEENSREQQEENNTGKEEEAENASGMEEETENVAEKDKSENSDKKDKSENATEEEKAKNSQIEEESEKNTDKETENAANREEKSNIAARREEETENAAEREEKSESAAKREDKSENAAKREEETENAATNEDGEAENVAEVEEETENEEGEQDSMPGLEVLRKYFPDTLKSYEESTAAGEIVREIFRKYFDKTSSKTSKATGNTPRSAADHASDEENQSTDEDDVDSDDEDDDDSDDEDEKILYARDVQLLSGEDYVLLNLLCSVYDPCSNTMTGKKLICVELNLLINLLCLTSLPPEEIYRFVVLLCQDSLTSQDFVSFTFLWRKIFLHILQVDTETQTEAEAKSAHARQKAREAADRRAKTLTITSATKSKTTHVEIQELSPICNAQYCCPEIGQDGELPRTHEEVKQLIKDFLYIQLPEQPAKASATMIYTFNKSKEKVKLGTEKLVTKIDSIIQHPSKEKRRKMRISNEDYQREIGCLQGIDEFLQTAGFTPTLLLHEGHEEMFWVMDEEHARNTQHLLEMKRALREARPLKPKLLRELKVFHPSPLATQFHFPIPEWFFRRPPEELQKKQLQKQVHWEKLGVLVPKTIRKQYRLEELHNHQFSLLRLRFPDGILLQGLFEARETLLDIRSFIGDNLEQDRRFSLKTTKGKVLSDDTKSLAEMGLSPTGIVDISWDQDNQSEAASELTEAHQGAYLKEETLAKIQFLGGQADVDNENTTTNDTPAARISNLPGPLFNADWQFHGQFAACGGKLQAPESDIVLTIPKNAVSDRNAREPKVSGEVAQTPKTSSSKSVSDDLMQSETNMVFIKGAISTNLKKVHGTLGMKRDDCICTPVVEYNAGDQFHFKKPVRISLPHFLERDFDRELVKVYQFHQNQAGETETTILEPLSLTQDVDGRDSEAAVYRIFAESDEMVKSKGAYYLTENSIEILTYHFSGVCATCGQKKEKSPAPLQLKLFASPLKPDTKDMRVQLFLWDRRLNIKDFEKSFRTEGLTNQGNKTLPGLTLSGMENSEVGVELMLSADQKNVWEHLKRDDGITCFLQPIQRVDLALLFDWECCMDKQPETIEWSLKRKPATETSTGFKCFVDVGYVQIPTDQQDEEDSSPLPFMRRPKKQTLQACAEVQKDDEEIKKILEQYGKQLTPDQISQQRQCVLNMNIQQATVANNTTNNINTISGSFNQAETMNFGKCVKNNENPLKTISIKSVNDNQQMEKAKQEMDKDKQQMDKDKQQMDKDKQQMGKDKQQMGNENQLKVFNIGMCVNDKQKMEKEKQQMENDKQQMENDKPEMENDSQQQMDKDKQEMEKDKQQMEKDKQQMDKDKQQMGNDKQQMDKDEQQMGNENQLKVFNGMCVNDKQEMEKDKQEMEKDKQEMEKDKQEMEKDKHGN